MRKDPAFLLYPTEFIAECFGLSESEIGTFLIVLFEQFNYGHLTGLDIMKKSNGNEKIIAKFSEDENGLFYNKWMQIKINERRAYSESRRKNRSGNTMLINDNTCSDMITHDNISKHNLSNNNIEDEDENKDINKNININSNKIFIPPTIEEVKDYLIEKKYTDIDPVRWWNFYNAKNWMIGKNKMKNWHSAIATWHKEPENVTSNRPELERKTKAQLYGVTE